MDKLRNAIKGKMDQSLDRIVRKTDSPFIVAIQECSVPSKFRLPQLKPFDRLKDPLDHLNTFKTTLDLQQPPDEILCRSFPTTLKRAAREWFNKLPTSSIDNFEQLRIPLSIILSAGNVQKDCRPFSHHKTRREGNLEILCNTFHLRNARGRRNRK